MINILCSVFMYFNGGIVVIDDGDYIQVPKYEINITDEKTIVDKQAKQEFYENLIINSEEQKIFIHGNAYYAQIDGVNALVANQDGVYMIAETTMKEDGVTPSVVYSYYVYPDEDLVCQVVINKGNKAYITRGNSVFDADISERLIETFDSYEETFAKTFGPKTEEEKATYEDTYIEYVYSREGYDVVKIGWNRNYATTYFIDPETLECHAMISVDIFTDKVSQIEFRDMTIDTESPKQNKISTETIFMFTSALAYVF